MALLNVFIIVLHYSIGYLLPFSTGCFCEVWFGR